MSIYKKKSLFNNVIFNFIKTLLGVVFPVITFTYSARILGVEGVGQVNFAKSIIEWFIMLAVLGMNYYGTREAAKLRLNRNELSKFTHEVLFINGVSTGLAYFLLFLLMEFVPRLHTYKTLLLLNSLAIVLQGMGMEWLYQALEEYRYVVTRSIAFQIVALIALFVFVRDAGDIVTYAAVSLMSSSGAYVMNFINARRFINWRWYGQYEIKKHLQPLLWLFAMAVSIELYTVLDSTMLGFLQGDGAVGRYTAAIKVNKLVNRLITSVGVVLIPRLSFYIGRGEKKRVNELVDKAYNYVFMLSVPAAVGLWMFSDEIILLFSGPKFASAGFTMKILTPIVLVIPFSATTNQQTFIPMGKDKLILRSTITGAVTNLICNLIMIPRFAENGAATATVVAEIAVAIVCFHNVRKYFNMSYIFRLIWQYFIAAFPIPLIVIMIGRWKLYYVISMVCATIISTIAYFVILMLIGNPYIREVVVAIHDRLAKRKEQSHQ